MTSRAQINTNDTVCGKGSFSLSLSLADDDLATCGIKKYMYDVSIHSYPMVAWFSYTYGGMWIKGRIVIQIEY